MDRDTPSGLHDSVVVGDSYHGTVIQEQHIHQQTMPSSSSQSVVHHMLHQQPSVGPDPITPSKQVWFLGNRIWHPQMVLMTLSVIVSFGILILPILPPLIGIGIAVYAFTKGDTRAVIPFCIGLVFLMFSFALV
jgi:hypothetical protein